MENTLPWKNNNRKFQIAAMVFALKLECRNNNVSGTLQRKTNKWSNLVSDFSEW